MRSKIKLEGEVPSDNDFANIAPTNINNSNVIEDNHSASNVFCCAALGDATTGTFYTGMTGSFPVTSLESMQAYLSRMIMTLILSLPNRAQTSKMQQS